MPAAEAVGDVPGALSEEAFIFPLPGVAERKSVVMPNNGALRLVNSAADTDAAADVLVFLEVAASPPARGVSLSASWLRVFLRLPDVGTRIGGCITPISAISFPGVSAYRDAVVDIP